MWLVIVYSKGSVLNVEERYLGYGNRNELTPDFQDHPNWKQLLLLMTSKDMINDRWLNDIHRYRQRLISKPISRDENLTNCLDRISRERLGGTLRAWGISTLRRKADVISHLVKVMCDQEIMDFYVLYKLSEDEVNALEWLLVCDGLKPWGEFIELYGDDFDESPYWQWHDPKTIPGRLRMFGLLAVGTLDEQSVVLIPKELRIKIRQAIEKIPDD